MSEAKGRLGPWTLGATGGEAVIVGDRDGRPTALFGVMWATDKEAQLAAAAPDLLEALERARYLMACAAMDETNPVDCATIDAAIAKAKGES